MEASLVYHVYLSEDNKMNLDHFNPLRSLGILYHRPHGTTPIFSGSLFECRKFIADDETIYNWVNKLSDATNRVNRYEIQETLIFQTHYMQDVWDIICIYLRILNSDNFPNEAHGDMVLHIGNFIREYKEMFSAYEFPDKFRDKMLVMSYLLNVACTFENLFSVIESTKGN